MKSTTVPIVIIAYRRPDKLANLLNELTSQTLYVPQIIVFVDGPASDEIKPEVDATVNVLKGFNTIPLEIHLREHNYGCRQNIIDALTQVFDRYEAAMVIEADISVAPNFYETMHGLLQTYRSKPEIYSVSGYCGHKMPDKIWNSITTDFFVSNRFQCWGWATWADRWHKTLNLLHADAPAYQSFLDYPITALTQTLFPDFYWHKQKLANTWAIPLAAITLSLGYGHIAPKYSFIKNTGFNDTKASHTQHEDRTVNEHYSESVSRTTHPDALLVHPALAKKATGFQLLAYWLKWGPWYFMVYILGRLGKNCAKKFHAQYTKVRYSYLGFLIPKWH